MGPVGRFNLAKWPLRQHVSTANKCHRHGCFYARPNRLVRACMGRSILRLSSSFRLRLDLSRSSFFSPTSPGNVEKCCGACWPFYLLFAKQQVVMMLAVAFNTCLVPVRPSPLASCSATGILELHGNLLPLQRVAFLRGLVGGTHVNAMKMRSDQEKSNCAWKPPDGATMQEQRV